jgi:hypothetical protein
MKIALATAELLDAVDDLQFMPEEEAERLASAFVKEWGTGQDSDPMMAVLNVSDSFMFAVDYTDPSVNPCAQSAALCYAGCGSCGCCTG